MSSNSGASFGVSPCEKPERKPLMLPTDGSDPEFLELINEVPTAIAVYNQICLGYDYVYLAQGNASTLIAFEEAVIPFFLKRGLIARDERGRLIAGPHKLHIERNPAATKDQRLRDLDLELSSFRHGAEFEKAHVLLVAAQEFARMTPEEAGLKIKAFLSPLDYGGEPKQLPHVPDETSSVQVLIVVKSVPVRS